MSLIKRVARMVAVGCFFVFVSSQIAFSEESYVPPTAEQIVAIANNPKLLKDYILKTTIDQTSDILLAVMKKVETSDLEWAEKQSTVEALFTIVYSEKGALAQSIIARVRKKVNPRLLPVISVNSGIGPSIPPSSPRYPRQ